MLDVARLDIEQQEMVEPSFSFGQSLDERRAQPAGQTHLDPILTVGGVHVRVADEDHGNPVPLKECQGGVRIADGGRTILVHCMRGDWVFRERLVHPDKDDLAGGARGFQVSFQPGQLFGAEPLVFVADIV